MTRIMTAHHKFNIGDRYFLYVPDELKAYRINKTLYEDLPLNYEEVNDKSLSDVLQSINLTKLAENTPGEALKVNPTQNYNVYAVSLNVAQICNMRCIYCYGNKGEYDKKGKMDRETALKSVDFLIKNSGDMKNLSICFFGGEPLLNFRLIKEIIEYSRKAEEYYNKHFYYSITTNGTLLNEENNMLLKKNNMSVTISFDGNKRSQDVNRPLRTRESSYDYIVPKIKEYFAFSGTRAIARVTLTKRSSKIKIMRSELENMGFKRMEFFPVSIKKGNYLEVTKSQLIDLIGAIKFDAEELILKIKNRQPVHRNSFVDILIGLLTKSKKEYYCGAGRTYTAIAADGKIYPCHRFVGNDKMCMGNIYGKTYNANRQFIIDTVDRNMKCKRCWAKYLCGGGCYHDNYEINGEIFKPNNNHCFIFRKKAEYAISAADVLSVSDKEYFKKSILSK